MVKLPRDELDFLKKGGGGGSIEEGESKIDSKTLLYKIRINDESKFHQESSQISRNKRTSQNHK